MRAWESHSRRPSSRSSSTSRRTAGTSRCGSTRWCRRPTLVQRGAAAGRPAGRRRDGARAPHARRAGGAAAARHARGAAGRHRVAATRWRARRSSSSGSCCRRRPRAQLPEDEAKAVEWAAQHPGRQEVRIAVGVVRDGGRECALRFRAPRQPTRTVLSGAEPGARPGRRARRHPRRPDSVRRSARRRTAAVRRTASAGAGGDVALAGAQGVQRVDGLVERRDPHEPQAVRDRAERLVAVGRRRQEDRGPGLARGDELLLDAADRADLALGVDRARAGDERPPVIAPGVSLSTMPRANISPALGPPTSSSAMSTLNGNS